MSPTRLGETGESDDLPQARSFPDLPILTAAAPAFKKARAKFVLAPSADRVASRLL